MQAHGFVAYGIGDGLAFADPYGLRGFTVTQFLFFFGVMESWYCCSVVAS
ncbi:hypothetical protein [Methylobacillus glycogenes]|nr:hypothetical protein [Methylobacillus glycogenes]